MSLQRLILVCAIGRDLVNPSSHEPFHIKVRVCQRRDRLLTDSDMIKFLLLACTHVTCLHLEVRLLRKAFE